MVLDKNGHPIPVHNGQWLSDQIGKDVKIWHPELVNLYGDYYIGVGCNIGAFVEIGPGVTIGERVSIGSHSFLPWGVIIEDDVFIGPRVTFCNDKNPPGGRDKWQKTLIMHHCSIGAGTIILPGIVLEPGVRVGGGSVVTKSFTRGQLIYGNPAKEVCTFKQADIY